MESQIILGRIIQRLLDQGHAQADGLNYFGFVKLTDSSIIVSREAGKDSVVPFIKILIAIDAYKTNNTLYSSGPAALRKFDIKFITSPIYALLHLLEEKDYD
jgi:hypothetical protein